ENPGRRFLPSPPGFSFFLLLSLSRLHHPPAAPSWPSSTANGVAAHREAAQRSTTGKGARPLPLTSTRRDPSRGDPPIARLAPEIGYPSRPPSSSPSVPPATPIVGKPLPFRPPGDKRCRLVQSRALPPLDPDAVGDRRQQVRGHGRRQENEHDGEPVLHIELPFAPEKHHAGD